MTRATMKKSLSSSVIQFLKQCCSALFITIKDIIFKAIFRYYYDESEDDIDDYSRKPVLLNKTCVYFQSAQNQNNNKLQKVLSTMIKPPIRSRSYFQSCLLSSTLLAGPSFSKCGRGGLSWTGPQIPHILTQHISAFDIIHIFSVPTFASSL